jgi:hypothetical protein
MPKITLDGNEALGLALSLADMITLAKVRTIGGERYVLLREGSLQSLIGSLMGLAKTAEIAAGE